MTVTTDRVGEVADTIRRQIGMGTLMSLGAHDFRATTMDSGAPALAFKARILPMKRTGWDMDPVVTRSERVRIMHVLIWLRMDVYFLRVTYIERGQLVTHYEANGVYADRLSRLMLALDYDGDVTLNPRVL